MSCEHSFSFKNPDWTGTPLSPHVCVFCERDALRAEVNSLREGLKEALSKWDSWSRRYGKYGIIEDIEAARIAELRQLLIDGS